jgi:toxin ParE1/3/4
MIVHISAEAEADPESIGDYIARDNPRGALSFVQELRVKCMDLADIARAFPLVPRYEQHGVRHRVHGNYLIFYREEGGKLIVLHILHGAMDYALLLFPT